MISVAAVALAVLATATVQFLAPTGDDEASTTDNLTSILEETTRRTAQADSSFTPPSVNNPATWPYASVRTLMRPLPFEASGLAQLLAAAEVTVLLGMYVLSWRRLLNLPRLAISVPYVTFAVTTLFLTGLAYTGLANFGILTRQKSLIMPFLLLLVCLPPRVRPNLSDRPAADDDRPHDHIGDIQRSPIDVDARRCCDHRHVAGFGSRCSSGACPVRRRPLVVVDPAVPE